MRQALVIVGKAPIPGQVKTRLCPPLTSDQAALLHRAFLRDTVALARAAEAGEVMVLFPPVAPAIGDAPAVLAEVVGPGVRLLAQHGLGLGAGLAGATVALLAEGYDRVALISSDNPDLPPATVAAALATLDEYDLALGPADDGGYYLIAMSRPHVGLFERITWSTPVVFDETCARAAELGLRLAVLPPWQDIDDIAGLRRLAAALAGSAGPVAVHTRAFLQAHFPDGLDG